MKELLRVQFDHAQCRRELEELRALLDANADLEENAHLKPFFEGRPQLSAFIGTLGWGLSHFDLVAFQYQLFGDFGCDLVVGDSNRRAFGFIEWEDATSGSIFRQQGRKATPEWASRYEHGFSQVLDWFWKLEEMAHTPEFEDRFGGRDVQHFGMIVAGRDIHLPHPRERRRLHWRSRKVLVSSQHIHCLTYDQLHTDLASQLHKMGNPSAPPP